MEGKRYNGPGVVPAKDTGENGPSSGVELVLRVAAVEMPDKAVDRVRARTISSLCDVAADTIDHTTSRQDV